MPQTTKPSTRGVLIGLLSQASDETERAVALLERDPLRCEQRLRELEHARGVQKGVARCLEALDLA